MLCVGRSSFFFKELKSTLGLHQYRFKDFRHVEHWVDLVLVTFFCTWSGTVPGNWLVATSPTTTTSKLVGKPKDARPLPRRSPFQ